MNMKQIQTSRELNIYTVMPIINSLENILKEPEIIEIELNFNNTNFALPGGITPLLAYLKENANTKHNIYI